jgi:transcriptional regulator with XRE-family HTH domain
MSELQPTQSLGQRIKACRQFRGISQKELADQLGVDPTTLGRWEREIRQPVGQIKKGLRSFFKTFIL